MKVRILSFDPGTASTGYAVLHGNTIPKTTEDLFAFGMIRTRKVKGGSSEVRERIDEIGQRLRQLVTEYRPTHIAVEDFTEQGKIVGKTYKEMAWLTEHFRLVGRELGIATAVYENGFWKRELTGAMRLNKAQVQHYVSHRLPKTVKQLAKQPDHVWDSVGVGLCCWNLLLRTGEI
jgi:Holliday junction resolvasome RuvABC endonuclease subunit